jgi:hypothetical protein
MSHLPDLMISHSVPSTQRNTYQALELEKCLEKEACGGAAVDCRVVAAEGKVMAERSAEAGTQGGVGTQTAVSSTHAASVGRITGRRNMNKKRKERALGDSEEPGTAKRPRYARILFGSAEIGNTPLAAYTETASPVPDVPAYELRNAEVGNTIRDHPHLFAVVTPVNVQALRVVAARHPNQALVESLCIGFEKGFWPYADTSVSRPAGKVPSRSIQLSDKVREFLRQQRDAEIKVRRYSEAFTPLLPGMVSQPIFAIPKPGTDNLRLINDHSAGNKSLNSLIPAEGGFMQLDSLQDLGLLIRQEMRRLGGQKPALLFKSDVSEAYRRLPVHPHWQVRQATEVDGVFHVDRCAVFGNRASGRIWCLFFGVITWIAIHVYAITGLLAYVDDTFSFDFDGRLYLYEGPDYSKLVPRKQRQLLRLWDLVGIKHSERKQEYGRKLTIIGFTVDLDTMTISMAADKRRELVSALQLFTTPPRQLHPLRTWLRLLGWANWALNVFPLLRPALNSSWEKTRGKSQMDAGIWLNAAVVADLRWFANWIERLDGVHVLGDEMWSVRDADMQIWCDASNYGLGFTAIWPNVGYFFQRDDNPKEAQAHTFFFEELCVLSAILWAALQPVPPRRLAVYTDSMNTQATFNSLRAYGRYNVLLMLAIDTLLESKIDLRVFHIAGETNTVADAISRGQFHLARQLQPGIVIRSFLPPQDALGALHK